jgi:2-polyprenyl-3-methyl-5-hydroxy-6-metoxy-1,4-benzoquinol methylase
LRELILQKSSFIENVFVDIDCPVCGGKVFKTVWRATPREFLSDFRQSYYNLDAIGVDLDTPFYIKRCKNCSFVFVNPRFRNDLYKVVYNEAKVGQRHQKAWAYQEGDLKSLYNTHHKWAASRILMRALSYLDGRFEKPKNESQRRIKLLDFGCGNGHLLDLCRVFEVEATGVDIDLHRIQFCREKGLNVCQPEGLEAASQFDVVVSTAVVEHVNDLHEYFRYVTDRLKSGGRLHLTGLNPGIIRKEKRRGTYRLVMPFEHLNYFTAGALDTLAGKYGLKRIQVSHLFQPTTKLLDYFTPFLKNVVFRGFYPTGTFEADLTKL